MAIEIPEENTMYPLTEGVYRRVIAWFDAEEEAEDARQQLEDLIEANSWSIVPDTEEQSSGADGRFLVACRVMIEA